MVGQEDEGYTARHTVEWPRNRHSIVRSQRTITSGYGAHWIRSMILLSKLFINELGSS